MKNELKHILECGAPGWGLSVRTYHPGDGVTRYRFFAGENSGFFSGNGIFTAMGLKEVRIFLKGWIARSEVKA